MKYLKIGNKGLLDVRLIALMGGTTKASDNFKIGNFGTGLKYTLSYLFRNGVDFKVFVGDEQVSICTEREVIQEQVFDIICIDGHRTSITTQMGDDWKAWMIIRELYSNALDEGDSHYSITEEITGETDRTNFCIQLTPDFLEVYNNWNDYFIVDKEPFYEDGRVKIYPQSGTLKLYKQGIMIYELEKVESLFNYDISDASINELREYKGFLESEIYGIIISIKEERVVRYFIENLNEEHYESSVDYNYGWGKTFNATWEDVLRGCKIIHQEAVDKLRERGVPVDTVTNVVVPKKLYNGLVKKIEGIGALMVSKTVNDFYEVYNEKLHDKTVKARKLLEDAGYYMDAELTYCYGIFGDKTTLAKIDLEKKKVFISEKHIEMDIFSICTMLVEENEHYKTGLSDETRAFQQHFINLFTNSIIEQSKADVL